MSDTALSAKQAPAKPRTAKRRPVTLERFFQRRSTIAFLMALPLMLIIFGLVAYPAGYAVHLATLNKGMEPRAPAGHAAA